MNASFVIPGSHVLDNKGLFVGTISILQLMLCYQYYSSSNTMSVLSNIELVKLQKGFMWVHVGHEPTDQFTVYYLIAEFDNESNALLARLSME